MTDFGLRFFYTNPSQILESLTDFCVCFLFTQLLADLNIYTSVEYFYIGVEEGSPATSPPVAASLAKVALMASSAVAPLAVSVLLPAAVAQTKNINFDEKMTRTISAKKIGNSLVHDGKKRLSTIPQSAIAPLSLLAGLSLTRLDRSMLPSRLVAAAATAASSIGPSNPLRCGSRSSVGSASGSGSVGGCGGWSVPSSLTPPEENPSSTDKKLRKLL